MNNRVLEYVIKAKDAASGVLQAAAEQFKRFANTVATSMGRAKEAMGDVRVEEKFIHTEAVLDAVSKALDRMGVSGERFNDVYDTLERRLNNFNRTGKGFDDLLQHFRLSMEDVGMSAKGVDHGLEILRSNLVKTGEDGTKSMRSLNGDMRAVHSIVGAMNGNVYALGRGITYLIGRFNLLKVSAGTLGLVAAAFYLVGEAVKKCIEYYKEQKRKLEELKGLRFEKTLSDYARAQREVNAELQKGEARIQDEVERKKTLIEQNKRLIEQELELARIKATEGKSGEELAAVNRSFDSQKALLDAQASIDRAMAEAAGQEATANLIGRLEAKIQAAREKISPELGDLERQLRSMADQKRRELEDYYRNAFGGMGLIIDPKTGDVIGRMTEAQRKAHENKIVRENRDDINQRIDDYMLTDAEVKKVKERRDKLREQMDGLNEDLERFQRERRKATEKKGDLETEAADVATDHEISVWADEQQRMEEYYRAVEENDRRLEAERIASEQRIHQQRMKDAEDEQRAAIQAQTEAERRLSTAQSRVSEAWGFYRDRTRLVAHDEERDRDAEARRQYQKDYQSLTTGRDADKFKEAMRIFRKNGMEAVEDQFAEWRRKKSLSIDSEATMRVAISENEQKEAYRNLERATDAVEASRGYLEQIANELQAED